MIGTFDFRIICTISFTSMSTVPRESSCITSIVRRCVVRVLDGVLHQRRRRRVEETLYLHDGDPAPARRRLVGGTRARTSARDLQADHAPDYERDGTCHPHQAEAPRSIRCMELAQFCASSRVVIVAGKGGVGKTTVAATLATAAARTGARVLVVEVEGKSGLASTFGMPSLTYEDAEVRPGLSVRTLSADDALLEYLADRGLHRISRRLVSSGTLDVVATAVPGMRDILLLGKVKQLEQTNAADLIVLDAPAAGHTLTFLNSPRGPPRRGEHGPGPRPGRRSGRHAQRPRPLPGAPGHVGRRDAGQRSGGDRVRASRIGWASRSGPWS